ncbi:MAG TPA: Na+/H+ antiporter NhaA [Longimicrobiales bacterium]|nr:Na+/H+ antiporter NhaA [Longimicrobiales bacterium]
MNDRTPKTRPPRAADVLVEPFLRFASLEASGGILLLGFAVVALIWANSPWGQLYADLWHIQVTVGGGWAVIEKDLLHWVNDGLMAVFFLLVGLELKRELIMGELASPRKAALPLFAAVGGMLIPAGLYLVLNRGGVGEPGWGIPMATDIAFALAVLAALGSRAPLALKIFLTALAIVDDLGAILVIALFYSGELSGSALGVAAMATIVLLLLNRAGFRRFLPYAVIGFVLWVAVLKSGVHATVAGVALAFTIPANTEEGEGHSPLEGLEHALHPWVAYLILPVFALANAGVAFGGAAEGGAPITNGILLGLVAGKPLGVLLFSFLAIRVGMAELPSGVTWLHILGVGFLAGIGFTMSLFIAGLAFPTAELLNASKVGILAASGTAAVVGTLILLRARPGPSTEAAGD